MPDSTTHTAGTATHASIVGIGGVGTAALASLAADVPPDTVLVAIDGDPLALQQTTAQSRLRLGEDLVRGLDGGDPAMAAKGAELAASDLAALFAKCDLVVIAAGLGGNTGSGATPVVARIARETGAVTVAVVTLPFGFERRDRHRVAQAGLLALRRCADTTVVIPHERMLTAFSNQGARTFDDLFAMASAWLARSAAALVRFSGDQARSAFGPATGTTALIRGTLGMMGFGEASGPDGPCEALRRAAASPGLYIDLDAARRFTLAWRAGDQVNAQTIEDATTTLRTLGRRAEEVIARVDRDGQGGDSVALALLASRLYGGLDSLGIWDPRSGRTGTDLVGLIGEDDPRLFHPDAEEVVVYACFGPGAHPYFYISDPETGEPLLDPPLSVLRARKRAGCPSAF